MLYKSRSSHRRFSLQKGVSIKFHKFHRKTPMLESFLNKVAGLKAYFQEYPYFEEHLRLADSVSYKS